MLYNKLKVFLAVFIAITMLFSSAAFAMANQGITYTALGDSIAYGTGATDNEGYTILLSEHLTRKFNECMYINLSYDGATSYELLLALNDPTVQAAIGASDVITISIGGNDLLRPFLKALGEVVIGYYMNPDNTVNIELLLSDLAEWEVDPTSHPQFNVMLSKLSEDLPAFLDGFNTNWAEIIYKIRDLNSNAEIFVNTVFNPFKFSKNLSAFADPAIQGLNLPIMSLAASNEYKVVDVYSKFEAYSNPKKLAVGDFSTLASLLVPGYNGPVPLHPTDMGYKFIFNMHKDLME